MSCACTRATTRAQPCSIISQSAHNRAQSRQIWTTTSPQPLRPAKALEKSLGVKDHRSKATIVQQGDVVANRTYDQINKPMKKKGAYPPKTKCTQWTSRHITSHHITPHHTTSHHITSHHITSHHITSHHITSHRITSHHITSHHITSHHITSHVQVDDMHIPSTSKRGGATIPMVPHFPPF